MHVLHARLASGAAIDGCGSWSAVVGGGGGEMLSMSAITRALDMSRWTAATNGWRSITSGSASQAGNAGVIA